MVPVLEPLREFVVGAKVESETCLADGAGELLVPSNGRFGVGEKGDFARRSLPVLFRILSPVVRPRRLVSGGEGDV